MNAVDLVIARLATEEGKKRFAYNDATEQRVTCQPAGNLSIGIGINLETGLDDEEIAWLTSHRIGKCQASLEGFWWWASLDPIRASVILDVAFNLGVVGLLHFVNMLSAVGGKDWSAAADALLDSKAARELPKRYEALALVLQSGVA